MSGNRARVPDDAMKNCASCGAARGTKKTGWSPILRGGQVLGYTCPSCPEWSEPITREQKKNRRVRWLATVVTTTATGDRLQRRKRFDALDDARSWVEETRQGLVSSSWSDPTTLTVRQIADRWLDHRRQAGGIQPGTLLGYEAHLASLLGEIGDVRARALTPGQIEAALAKLATVGGKKKRPLSHRSRSYSLMTLRQVFDYSTREGWTLANPAKLVKVAGKPKKVRERSRWTVAELQQFRAYVDDTYADAQRLAAEPWAPVAMRLALSGLRRSEVMGLAWEGVNLEDGTVTITASRTASGPGRQTVIGPPKTANSERTVAVEALHPGTKKLLKALHLQQGQPTNGLVVLDAAGEPVHPDTLSWRFKSLCKETGVPFPGAIHQTRHTLATALEEAGVPANQGAALLGHDVATYLRFYVLADDDAAAQAAKVGGSIFSTPASSTGTTG